MNMVKRRKPAKTRTRTIIKRVRSKVKGSKSINATKSFVSGGIYGFMRTKLNGFVNRNIASKIPLGQYSDEVVFTLASYMLSKRKGGIAGIKFSDVGKSGLMVEGSLVGSQLANRMLPASGNNGGGF